MITSLQDGYCHNTAAVCGAKLSNYTNIPSGNEDALRVAIATKGPVAVAIDASHKSFSFYAYGVYYEKECGMCVRATYRIAENAGGRKQLANSAVWIIWRRKLWRMA